jgi:hypothetical protein
MTKEIFIIIYDLEGLPISLFIIYSSMIDHRWLCIRFAIQFKRTNALQINQKYDEISSLEFYAKHNLN